MSLLCGSSTAGTQSRNPAWPEALLIPSWSMAFALLLGDRMDSGCVGRHTGRAPEFGSFPGRWGVCDWQVTYQLWPEDQRQQPLSKPNPVPAICPNGSSSTIRDAFL